MPAHPSPRALPHAACACALLLAGCAEAPASAGWAGILDTLPGGAVHVRSPERGLWEEGAVWRLVEDLRIGAIDAQGPEQLERPGAIAIDGQRRLWITQPGAGEVRVFGPDGTWVRTVGRPGAGPGELGTAWGITFGPGGEAWVHDPRNRRYQVFDSAGAHRAGHRMEGLSFSGEDAWGADGRFYRLVSLPDGARALRRALVASELSDGVLTPVDTTHLPALPAGNMASVTWSAGGLTMRMERPIPFTPQPLVHVGPAGVVWLGDAGGAYRIARLTPAGDTTLIVERPFTPVAVADSSVEAALAAMGPPDARVDLDRDRIPGVHPPFEALHAAPDGTLWVRRHAHDGVAYDVFDPEGRYLGQATSALDLARFQLHAVTPEALYGVLLDELDVPYVVRLRVER